MSYPRTIYVVLFCYRKELTKVKDVFVVFNYVRYSNFQPKPLENVIPCRKCHREQLLPDAAILQFRSDGTGSKSFVAELKFEILPSKDDQCTVTEYDALIRIDVSQVSF